jgi:thiol:disulfide interchange protein DsbD
MLKRIFLTGWIIILGWVTMFAQVKNPVKWSFQVINNGTKNPVLIFKATINKTWHLYSTHAGDGPISTSFKLNVNPTLYKPQGNIIEATKPLKHFDENFGTEVSYFENEAVFKQPIQVLSTSDFKISGTLEFMVCDDHQCLPPEELEFSFDIKGISSSAEDTKSKNELMDDKKNEVHLEINNSNIDTGSQKPLVNDSLRTINQPNIKPENTIVKPAQSAWGIFWGGFIGGLLALLTPCVFPMIPLTVSFFTKRSKTRAKGISNALIYGLNIILIYTFLGLLITKALGPDALNAMASNAIFNLVFFVIILLFAISFLGAFEITLPSAFVNKVDAASDRGGLIGIFFMAFTLSLVSFSCTGPIIGTLLVEAAVNGSTFGPLMGMFGFSLALALPFALFAAFPGWLNSLPKSGGWLNSVKVVLGLLELALSLKFLSNVDLAYGWGVITREIFIALWIVIFSILGFYLLGKIKFSHDSDLPYVSIPRLFLSLFSFAFVVYLIPGMWGAPLKIISGFPPPGFYNEGWSLATGKQAALKHTEITIPGTDPEHCPHGLNCFHDYTLALTYAKKVKKPLLVDFTGWSCVNCRKMEDKVWIDPSVLQKIQNEYVLVSLYVDDKTPLPDSLQYVSKTTGKKIKTIGNKWSDFQTERYKTNTQPYYVLLDTNEQLLTAPESYNPDIKSYEQFLTNGIIEFKRRIK